VTETKNNDPKFEPFLREHKRLTEKVIPGFVDELARSHSTRIRQKNRMECLRQDRDVYKKLFRERDNELRKIKSESNLLKNKNTKFENQLKANMARMEKLEKLLLAKQKANNELLLKNKELRGFQKIFNLELKAIKKIVKFPQKKREKKAKYQAPKKAA